MPNLCGGRSSEKGGFLISRGVDDGLWRCGSEEKGLYLERTSGGPLVRSSNL